MLTIFFTKYFRLLNCIKYPNRPCSIHLVAPTDLFCTDSNLSGLRKIDKATIEYLEKVSLVGFESAKAVQIVEEAIRFADQIFEVDTTGVEPLVTVLEDECLPLREDIVRNDVTRSELMSHTTESMEYYFITPSGIVNKPKANKFDKISTKQEV